MGTVFEEQDVFLTDQEHVRTTAAPYSNAVEYYPSEWTFPGCGHIRTKARFRKCYKWKGVKMTKHNIPPESVTATF